MMDISSLCLFMNTLTSREQAQVVEMVAIYISAYSSKYRNNRRVRPSICSGCHTILGIQNHAFYGGLL